MLRSHLVDILIINIYRDDAGWYVMMILERWHGDIADSEFLSYAASLCFAAHAYILIEWRFPEADDDGRIGCRRFPHCREVSEKIARFRDISQFRYIFSASRVKWYFADILSTIHLSVVELPPRFPISLTSLLIHIDVIYRYFFISTAYFTFADGFLADHFYIFDADRYFDFSPCISLLPWCVFLICFDAFAR